MQKDTHEVCMERAWRKLLDTTWSEVNLNERQDVTCFLEAFFRQLSKEMKIDAIRYWELQQIVRVCHKTRVVCKDCGFENPLEDERKFLRASFPEINGQAPWYGVAEAIKHNLQQATLPWTCDGCLKSSKYNNTAEPRLTTKHIEKLPEILFVQVDHYGHHGHLNGRLRVEDTLVISKGLRYPGSPEEENICYELYSIIFRKQSATDGEYVTAAKGPGCKWALIKNDIVTDELTLDKLLDIVDAQQKARILAYRRLPLNGIPPKPASEPIPVPSTPTHTAVISSIARPDGPCTPVWQGAPGCGVTLEQVINLRDGIEWTVNQRLPFPVGVDRLVELKGKARTQRAKVRLTFTSGGTGEVLEGEALVSLTQKKKRKANARDGPPKKRGRPLGSRTGSGVAKKAEPARAKTPDPPLKLVYRSTNSQFAQTISQLLEHQTP
ncbi:hypothetical protein BJY01DRAFT_251790 [Aspergillus pseudoustus]|uniref:USP domain-containing protein n=1 Tax=Aspergillus pseudoustus TaxID=1810923 RepID=A0ABR4JB87_9EURO